MNLPILPIIKSVTDLRYQTAHIIKLLAENKPVIVTRENDTVAVMLSPGQYQQLLSLFEELENHQDAQKIERIVEDGGEFIDFHAFDKKQRKKLKLS